MDDNMNVSRLAQTLINTYNPDVSLRQAAEGNLQQLLHSNGSLSLFLSLIASGDLHRDVRQAACIVIKNKIREMWSDEVDETRTYPLVSPQEKIAIKNGIIPLLLNEHDNPIRGTITEIIRVVSEFDYPNNWPDLIAGLVAGVTSNNILHMYNSLLALRKVMKRFEYKQKDSRNDIDDIILVVFPLLQQLSSSIATMNSIEAAMILKMCLKIFYSATMYALPDSRVCVDYPHWLKLVGHVIEKVLPEGSSGQEPLGQPVDKEDRKLWPWWKLKKWASRIAQLFMQRYGNPRYVSENYKSFAETFSTDFAPALLFSFLNQFSQKANGAYISDDTHRFGLNYISSCVELKTTYKMLKPHLSNIIYHIIFPGLCISSDDETLFASDPNEFIRKVHDPMEDWLDLRIASVNLLQTMAKYRKKDSLPIILPYLSNMIIQYNAADPSTKNYRIKDGVMVAMSGLNKILKESKNREYSGIIQPFITSQVIPEFSSPVAFIRFRACWSIEYIDETDLKQPAILPTVLQGLLTGLRDPTLPVQAAAACSLRHLITTEGTVELLRPFVTNIVQEYFRIMDEVDNDSVLSALQVIVENFPEEIQPIACTMVAHLMRSFASYTSGENEDDQDESAFNATQCLDTILCIIETCENNVAVLAQIETTILPLLQKLLQDDDNYDSMEYITHCFQIMESFTRFPDVAISPSMWSLVGPTLTALDSFAIDFIDDIMPPILNYMTRDMATFFATTYNGRSCISILWNTISKLLAGEKGPQESERDDKYACTLLSCAILASKSYSLLQEPFIREIIQILRFRLSNTRSNGLKDKLLECLLALLYYDHRTVISLLTGTGDCDSFFNLLLTHAGSNFKAEYSQRLLILAYTSLLSDAGGLPPMLQQNAPSLFSQCIEKLHIINENDNYNEETEVCDDDEELSSNDDINDHLEIPDDGFDEDEDCVNLEDEEYLRALSQGGISRRYIPGEVNDDNDDDYDEYEYSSPIDSINVLSYFITSLQSSAATNPSLAGVLQSSLTADNASKLTQLMTVLQQEYQP